jgi:hypothetical protein
MAYINLHGEEYIYGGTPAQFAAFVKDYGRRLAWGAPSPAYLYALYPPVFRLVLPNKATVLAWDSEELIEKDTLEVMFEYEVYYPLHAMESEWRPAKGFIKAVSLPSGKSILTVWTTLDRSHSDERKHVMQVWDHLKDKLNKLGLLQTSTDISGQEIQNSHNRNALRTLMMKVFDASDIRTLCFDLEIDYENLQGNKKVDKIRELIHYCERSGIIESLIGTCREERPKSVWPDPW